MLMILLMLRVNWFSPGGIDPHVHLDMPFMGTFSSDNYETGTRAALFGGTTMVIDFILQKQGNSLRAALEEWKGRSDGNCVGDYSFPYGGD
jgi:dihydropyrimidinase